MVHGQWLLIEPILSHSGSPNTSSVIQGSLLVSKKTPLKGSFHIHRGSEQSSTISSKFARNHSTSVIEHYLAVSGLDSVSFPRAIIQIHYTPAAAHLEAMHLRRLRWFGHCHALHAIWRHIILAQRWHFI